MNTDDKPFACPEPECNMCFSNVDHLNVHKQKHKMSLSLGPGTARGFLFTGDQTPTPTKCLRNLDQEITLFGELSKPTAFEVHKNPFEEAFRKAAQEVESANIPLPVPCGTRSQPGDSLNTPVPPVGQVVDGPSISKTIDTVDDDTQHPQSKRSIQSLKVKTSGNELEDVKEGSPEPGEIQALPPGPMDLSVSRGDSIDVEPVPQEKITQPTTRSAAGMLPGIGSVTASPTISVIAPADSQSVACIKEQPQCMAVLVKLPNGTTVPVQLPAQLTSASQQPVSIHSMVTEPVTVSSSSVTKQKLKEALMGQNMHVMSEAVDSLTTPAMPVSTQSLLAGSALLVSRRIQVPMSRGPDVQTRAADTSTPNRKRKAEEDDPDERRKKFLERNRAAAARCRQKKKVWINGLEQKADDLQGTNNALLNEVAMLKSEVAQLKQLLLAHKNCPITLQQQNAGQISFQEVQTLEVTTEGMKVVANTVLVTPQRKDPSESPAAPDVTTKK